MTGDANRERVLEDFDQARKEAALKEILSGLQRKNEQLLGFDEIQGQFAGQPESDEAVQTIPLDSVRGSVGRYNDFNRDFLPTNVHDRERWANVKLAMESNIDLPPIQVYQVGEIFFVIDGNHRVSISKRRGDTEIRARVTRIPARVSITPDDSIEDVVRKSALNQFLEATHLDETHKEQSFLTTEVRSYSVLLQQIEMVQFKASQSEDESISFPEAAATWFDEYFNPIVEILRQQNLLKHYPDRTETDLYVWILENHQKLVDEFGWGMHLETVAANLAARKQSGGRLKQMLQTAADPENTTGSWRERQLAIPKGRMFSDILVVLDLDDPTGPAFQHALRIAGEENAHLLGLWVQTKDDPDEETFLKLQQEYEQGCGALDVYGRLAMGRGDRNELVQARARWADLLVVQSSRGRAPSSALQKTLAGVHIPVWVARREQRPLDRVLLAYDGRPKANEALFLTAYIGALWGLDVSVLTVQEPGASPKIQQQARDYLESYNIDARYLSAEPPIPEGILSTLEQEAAGLLVTGSVHTNRLGRNSLGKTLDRLLTESPAPLLICR